MSRYPLVFRDWTIRSPEAIRERFYEDLAANRGWYPPDPSPILWLADLAHEHPAAVPVAEQSVDELLDDADPARVQEGIIGVEGIPSVPAQVRLARRVSGGWNHGPDALRAAVSKLLLLERWMREPGRAQAVATAAERAGIRDLAARLRFAADPRDAGVWDAYVAGVHAGEIGPVSVGADAAWVLAVHPDLAERHCRLAARFSDAERRSILASVAVVARSRGVPEDRVRTWLGL